MFKDVSTRMKLMVSFGAVVVFNVCFGLYSIRSLALINSRVVESDSWAVGITQAVDLEIYASSARRLDLSYALTADPNQRKGILEERAPHAKNLVELLQVYRDEVLSLPYDSEELREQDLRKADEIGGNWNAYEAVANAIAEAVEAGDGKGVNLMVDNSLQTYQTLENSIVSLAKYNADGAAAAMETSNEIYVRAKTIVIALFVLASIVSVAAAVLLTRGMKRSVGELLKVSESLRNCDLGVSARVFSNDEFGMLANSYNLTIAKFKSLISEIRDSADLLEKSANYLKDSAVKSSDRTGTVVKKIEDVSKRTGGQQNELELIMSTMNGLSGEITGTTALLDSLASTAAESVQQAKEGNLAIEKAVEHMDMIEETVNSSAAVVSALGERSDEIGRIVETISALSSQTNLLALNAAIEAARAGDLGKGFAVVADEVKNLAGESRSAAEEIAKLIASIQEETSKAVESINNGKVKAKTGSEAVKASGVAFSELSVTSVKSHEQIQDVTATMHKMSSMTEDIASQIGSVGDSGRKIAENSVSVAAAAEKQAEASAEMLSASQNLTEIAQVMLKSIHHFSI